MKVTIVLEFPDDSVQINEVIKEIAGWRLVHCVKSVTEGDLHAQLESLRESHERIANALSSIVDR